MNPSVAFVVSVVVIALTCGPILVVGICPMPLAPIFRHRLRDLLAVTKRTQTALADHLKLDGGQVSRILKYDQSAGAVTVARLEEIAAFFPIAPSNLIRAANDEPVSLTTREQEILDLVRMLPEDQQDNLVKWLAYVFPERRSAQAEMAVMRSLNVSRQKERDREREEVGRLRKQHKR